MAKSSSKERTTQVASFDIDTAILDALVRTINKTPKSKIIEKLRLGAESDDDFRRWLVLLFEPDLVSPFSIESTTPDNSKSNKSLK